LSGLGLRTGAITAAGCRTSVPISSGHSLYDGPVADHTLALLLACPQRLDRLYLAQQSKRWDEEYIDDQASQDSSLITHSLT
jgi:phosphoglycerate dehydrogenase-like enzyme